jgi:hypothetical protein
MWLSSKRPSRENVCVVDQYYRYPKMFCSLKKQQIFWAVLRIQTLLDTESDPDPAFQFDRDPDSKRYFVKFSLPVNIV